MLFFSTNDFNLTSLLAINSNNKTLQEFKQNEFLNYFYRILQDFILPYDNYSYILSLISLLPSSGESNSQNMDGY